MRFDTTELENPLREILHADDKWTFVDEVEGEDWNISSVKTEVEAKVDQIAEGEKLNGNQAAFIRERVIVDSGDMEERYARAKEELENDGPSYMDQLDLLKSIVTRTGEKKLTAQPKTGDGIITWGKRIPLGDCEAQGLTLGKLHFRAIDFGDAVRLSERSRKSLGPIEPHEKNQCVLLHTVAGTQRLKEGKKNGIPVLARVLAEAEEWRKGEYVQAKEALKMVGDLKGEHAAEIRSASHDVIQNGHDRGYRSFVLFYKELMERNDISVRVFDLRSRDGGGYILTVNLFKTSGADDDTPMIDLVTYHHHVRWLKMCEDTLLADRKSRKVDFGEHYRGYIVTGCKVKIEAIQDDKSDRIATLNPCRHCKLCIKTPHAPDRFYGKEIEKAAWNCAPGPRDIPYSCGMNVEPTSYPLLDLEWRTPGPLQLKAAEYIEAADVDFSLMAAHKVATLGNQLAHDCSGEIRYAARCVQEIEMRKLEPQAQSTITLLDGHPELRDKIVRLHTIGALPFYRGPPPETHRPSGLPYDESKTVEMVGKIWKDVRLGRVLVVTSHVAGKDAPIIATPTTTVQKKLPGRTLSGDFRIISDLRLPNLFCDKDDYPPVKMADISQISERAVAMKLKWPHVTIMCNTRDIDAAFKRVKVHPDMSVILGTEFSAQKLGMEDGESSVLFLYLTLPFGWRASPSYFSQVGEGVTLAHRAFISSEPKRGGADYFSSLLFVDDAIFVEPVIGGRREMVISCWGNICRRILGATAVNKDKVDLEGEWKTSHILLGFEVDVDRLAIKLPTAKRVGAREYFQDSMFNPGNRIATVTKVQELRGLTNHWSYTNRFWHYSASPINGLLSFVDSTNAWIRCANDQVWIAFWNLIALIRSIGEDDEQWDLLFIGRLEQNIPLPKRVGRKKGSGKVIWATGDAVISRIGAINWERKDYIVEDTVDSPSNNAETSSNHNRRFRTIGCYEYRTGMEPPVSLADIGNG